MKRDTREAIAMPPAILIVLLMAYGMVKGISAMPSGASHESIFGGVLLIAFIGVPVFFGTIMAVVALCIWSSSGDNE